MVRTLAGVLSLEFLGAAAYSASQAIAWSGSHCGDSDGTQCAEFASNALRAGGHTMCYNAYVPTLDNCLKKTAGWQQKSFPCSAGCVVVWTDSQGPYHMAVSRGSGIIDQHNPNRCGTSGSWGSNYCLCPPYFEEASLEAAPQEQHPLEVKSTADAAALSMSQIAGHWISAYGKSNCQTAVAVAMAESRGDCNAQYTNGPGSIDRGLWQINSYWHPECSDSCAYSCSCNAGCAVNVWKSSGWSAWATYNNGLHSKYMNDAAVACGYTAQDVLQETQAHNESLVAV